MGGNSWDGEKSGDLADTMAGEICGYFKATSVAVSPANEDRPTTGPNNPPYSFFITDISDEVYDALIERMCIASKKIQFIICPLRYPGPCSYMGSVMGLVNVQDLSDKRKGQLLDDLRELLYNTPGVYDTILNIALDHTPPVNLTDFNVNINPEEDVDYFIHDLLSELRIKVIMTNAKNGVLKPAVNLYLDIPGDDNHARFTVKNAFASVTFNTSRFGKGYYQSSWRCHMCRAVDHPTGLCPFKDVLAWKEITESEKTPPTDTAAPTTAYTSSSAPRGGTGGQGHRGGPPRGTQGNSRERGHGRGTRGY